MSGKIFMIKDDDELVAMDEKKYKQEIDFQDLLEEYPDLIPGDQIDSENPRRWLLVKRELGIPFEEQGAKSLSLDHFFLDQDGIPTLVEVKRSSDTRLRREVVAQMLDYAANAVSFLPVEEIKEKLGDITLQDDFLDENMDENKFWQNVKSNLEEGKIRMLFIADEIPMELKTIIEFLNNHMNKPEVLGVEIKQYVANEEKIRTLVSRVIGQTVEARPIIRKDPYLTKVTFFENLDQCGKTFFKELFKFSDENGLVINWGTRGFSLNVSVGNKKVSLLQGYSNLRANGQTMYSTIGSISKKVENGEEIVANYVEKTLELKDFKKESGGFIFNLGRDLTDEEWLKFKKILIQTVENIKKMSIPGKEISLIDKKPSWIGKRPEEMTDTERKEYKKNVADRFTWQPGDLTYLGNIPLTDDEKNFVDQIKKMEADEKASDKKE
jgi:hypothetical protein